MGALACKTKIILDSGSAAGYAGAIAKTVMALSDKEAGQLTDAVAYPIIEQLITAETALEKAHNLLLDAVGYDGPRPS
jgi:hypothetical protein